MPFLFTATTLKFSRIATSSGSFRLFLVLIYFIGLFSFSRGTNFLNRKIRKGIHEKSIMLTIICGGFDIKFALIKLFTIMTWFFAVFA